MSEICEHYSESKFSNSSWNWESDIAFLTALHTYSNLDSTVITITDDSS